MGIVIHYINIPTRVRPGERANFAVDLHLEEPVRDCFWFIGYREGPAGAIRVYINSLKREYSLPKGRGVAVVFRLKPEYVRVCQHVEDAGYAVLPEEGEYELLFASGEFDFENWRFERVESSEAVKVEASARLVPPVRWEYLAVGGVLAGIALSGLVYAVKEKRRS